MRTAAMCMLEGGGGEPIGLGGLEVVAHVVRADVLHALPAAVFQKISPMALPPGTSISLRN